MSAVPSAQPSLQHDLKSEFGHTGPGTLAGRWMRQFWQPVLNAEDLAPGKAIPIRIMSEDFTLFRGWGEGRSGGVAQVVAFRCPHRLTQLSTGWVEGDEIRCLYHGWKFNTAGRCTERPQEPGRSGGNVAIRSYPTREHIGLIFCYFGEGEPPPFPPFPGWKDEGFIETRSTHYPCNFFQTHENNYDPCHILWSHSHGITHEQFASLDMSRQESPEETEYGTVNRWTFGNGFRVGMIGYLPNAIRTIVPAPNAFLKRGFCQQYRDSYLVHVPVDDETHIFFRAQMIRLTGAAADRYKAELARVRDEWKANWKSDIWYMDEILAGRLHITDILEHPYLATIQDMVAQTGQGRNTDRSQERLGVSDRHMTFLRRIWARELAALAAGQPTKRWAALPECPALEEFRGPLIEAGTL